MQGKVGLSSCAVQADANPVIHTGRIFFSLIVTQVGDFAMHQDARLPLVFAVAGANTHEAAGALPAAEPPARYLCHEDTLSARALTCQP